MEVVVVVVKLFVKEIEENYLMQYKDVYVIEGIN